MSLAIPNNIYNQQALVSTKLMFDTIANNKEILKECLPEADAVIEISVETREGDRKYVQRVAAIRLNNLLKKEGKLGVNIAIYKCEHLARLQIEAAPSLTPTSQALISLSSDQTVAIPYFQVIDPSSVETMKGMKASSRCPQALQVLNLIRKAFEKGIPLPAQTQTVIKSHIEVMICDKNEKIECLRSYQGFASYHAGAYLSTGVEERVKSESEYPRMREEFNHLVGVAKGERLPVSMPTNTVVSSSSIKLLDQKV